MVALKIQRINQVYLVSFSTFHKHFLLHKRALLFWESLFTHTSSQTHATHSPGLTNSVECSSLCVVSYIGGEENLAGSSLSTLIRRSTRVENSEWKLKMLKWSKNIQSLNRILTLTQQNNTILSIVWFNFLVIYFSGLSLFLFFFIYSTHRHTYKKKHHSKQTKNTQASVRKTNLTGICKPNSM